jgi:dUTP pyrophosphatase
MDEEMTKMRSEKDLGQAEMPKVEFIPLPDTNVALLTKPSYATKLSSGIDLRAYIKQSHGNITVYPQQRAIIPTGYKVKIHPNYEGQIRSRSGLAINQGIMVLNEPATIDADYDGPLNVILYNTSPDIFIIHNGDRIAQFVVCSIARERMYMPEDAPERGTGGFGSTGIK